MYTLFGNSIIHENAKQLKYNVTALTQKNVPDKSCGSDLPVMIFPGIYIVSISIEDNKYIMLGQRHFQVVLMPTW